MQSLLIATSLLFLVQSAAEEPSVRRAVELHVRIIGIDESVSVPDDSKALDEFVAGIGVNAGLRWKEEFRLHTLENASAKCSMGSLQPIVTGYSMSAFGRGPTDPTAPGAAGGRGSGRPDAAPGNGRARSVNTITQMQSVGTSLSLAPSIRSDGRLLVVVNVDSTRIEEQTKKDSSPDETPVPQSVIHTWSVQTSIVATSGQAVLLKSSESDSASGVPGQTVLIILTAEVEKQ